MKELLHSLLGGFQKNCLQLFQDTWIFKIWQIFGAGGALIQKKNKEKEKGKGKEERREKRKKERGEFNLEDPMFLLISILSSKKL